MTARTASQIGRASRDKGARFERAVAAAIKPWFPDVRRSRDNGSATTTDTGDLTDTGPGLFWSLKDDKSDRVAAWMAEAAKKGGEYRLPLLVVKRAGHADPLRSWCWLWVHDLASLCDGERFPDDAAPVRLELRTALDLLAAAGYALDPERAAS